jgi:hypothetical protein
VVTDGLDRLDDPWARRHDHPGPVEVGVGQRDGQHLVAGGVPPGDEVERLLGEGIGDDGVLDAGRPPPRAPRRVGELAARGHVQGAVGQLLVGRAAPKGGVRHDRQQPAAARRDDQERPVEAGHRHPRVQAPGQDHDVVGGVGAEAVQQRAAVQTALPGRGVLGRVGVMVVDEGRERPALFEPAHEGEQRPGEGVVEQPAGGRLDQVQGAPFRAALGDAAGHVTPVGRGHVPVDGAVGRPGHRPRVEQDPLGPVPGAAHDERGHVGAGVLAKVEHGPAGGREPRPGGPVAAQLSDSGEQGAPGSEAVQDRAGVGRLPLQPGADLVAGGVLQPPVGVFDGDAEVGVPDHLGPRGRGGHGAGRLQRPGRMEGRPSWRWRRPATAAARARSWPRPPNGPVSSTDGPRFLAVGRCLASVRIRYGPGLP